MPKETEHQFLKQYESFLLHYGWIAKSIPVLRVLGAYVQIAICSCWSQKGYTKLIFKLVGFGAETNRVDVDSQQFSSISVKMAFIKGL